MPTAPLIELPICPSCDRVARVFQRFEDDLLCNRCLDDLEDAS